MTRTASLRQTLATRCLALAGTLAACSGGARSSAAPSSTSESDSDATDVRATDDAVVDVGVDAANDAPSETSPSLVVLPAEFTEESMPLRMLVDGDPIHLWKAPQGGHVVLVSAKVENLTSNTATLRVRMRRPGGIIVAEESRTVAMVPVPGEPLRMQPDIRSRSQAAHVPLCPDYDTVDIVDEPLDVDVEVTALYTDPPLSGTTTLRLTPTCSDLQDLSLCRCECEAHYVLGRCNLDAAQAEGG